MGPPKWSKLDHTDDELLEELKLSSIEDWILYTHKGKSFYLFKVYEFASEIYIDQMINAIRLTGASNPPFSYKFWDDRYIMVMFDSFQGKESNQSQQKLCEAGLSWYINFLETVAEDAENSEPFDDDDF